MHMLNPTGFFTILLVTIGMSEADIKCGKDGFKYIGTSSSSFDDKSYFFSLNPTSWAAARADCKAIFGNQASLLSLESEDEINFINEKLLSSGSTATRFWMSGLLDNVWKWDNGLTISAGTWVPWGANEPAHTNSQARTVLSYKGGLSSAWETHFQSDLYRYICETPRSDIPVPCPTTNDLMIVVDSSGSIGATFYKDALNFAAKLAVAWKNNGASHVGCNIYSNGVTSVLDLNNNLSADQAEAQILNAPYLGGGTNTHLGINNAIDQIVALNAQVPHNLVVITDGVSSSGPSTLASAQKAKDKGIAAFAIGVTNNVNSKELLDIADGKADHVFDVDSYNELVQLLRPVSLKVCTRK